AAADPGMAGRGFRRYRCVRGLPAARIWPGVVARNQTAADAHRAAARLDSYGAGPGPRRRNSGTAGAAGAGRSASAANWWRRGFKFRRFKFRGFKFRLGHTDAWRTAGWRRNRAG